MKTYVINLDRDRDRWSIISQRLAYEGFKFERITAIDGRQLDKPEIHVSNLLPRMIFGRDLSATEIACYLSHSKVWQKIVDDNISAALILEDDAIPLTGCREMVENMRPDNINLHLIRLHILKEQEVISRGWLKQASGIKLNNHDVYFQAGPVWSLAAYIVTNEGAMRLLRASKIRWPADCLSFSSLFYGLRHGVCLPLLFSRDGELKSTMQARQKISTIKKITSGYFLLGRFRDRIIAAIDLTTLRSHRMAIASANNNS